MRRVRFRFGQRVRLNPVKTRLSPEGYPGGEAIFVREYPPGMGIGGYQFKMVGPNREVFVPYLDVDEVVGRGITSALSEGWFKDWKDHPLPAVAIHCDVDVYGDEKPNEARQIRRTAFEQAISWLNHNTSATWVQDANSSRIKMDRGPYQAGSLLKLYGELGRWARAKKEILFSYARLHNFTMQPFGTYSDKPTIPFSKWEAFFGEIRKCHSQMDKAAEKIKHNIPGWLGELFRYTGTQWKLNFTSNVPSTELAKFKVSLESGSDSFSVEARLPFWPRIPSTFEVWISYRISGNGKFLELSGVSSGAFDSIRGLALASKDRTLLELTAPPDVVKQQQEELEERLFMDASQHSASSTSIGPDTQWFSDMVVVCEEWFDAGAHEADLNSKDPRRRERAQNFMDHDAMDEIEALGQLGSILGIGWERVGKNKLRAKVPTLALLKKLQKAALINGSIPMYAPYVFARGFVAYPEGERRGSSYPFNQWAKLYNSVSGTFGQIQWLVTALDHRQWIKTLEGYFGGKWQMAGKPSSSDDGAAYRWSFKGGNNHVALYVEQKFFGKGGFGGLIVKEVGEAGLEFKLKNVPLRAYVKPDLLIPYARDRKFEEIFSAPSAGPHLWQVETEEGLIERLGAVDRVVRRHRHKSEEGLHMASLRVAKRFLAKIQE